MATQRTDAGERLLNLVIALTSARRRMSREQIFNTVVGYSDDASQEAVERKFERDKNDLRAMGIPIITETDPFFDDDMGYRIDMDSYAMGQVDLTGEELAVLSVASRFWRDASLGEVAQRGLNKLIATGIGIDPHHDLALMPAATPPGRVFEPLLDAITDRRVVKFTYRAASSGEQSVRKVEPWRLIGGRGAWYLIGRDVDRGEPRSFRLSRIMSKVQSLGNDGAYSIPEDIDVSLPMSATQSQTQEAKVQIRHDRAHLLRSRKTSEQHSTSSVGFDELTIPYEDTETMASLIAGYGADVIVDSPSELRDAVVRRLEAVSTGAV